MPFPTISNASLFEDALQSNEAIEVPVGAVDFVSFTSGQQIRTIGTRGLNGGSAVVLVSTKGAILANVPLFTYNMDEPNAGLAHVWRRMIDFLNLYNKKKRFFMDLDEKRAAIVCRLSPSHTPFSQYNTIFESVLSSTLGVIAKPKVISYLFEEGGHNQPDRGAVFIDGRNEPPKVYVEDTDQHWFE
ncbi:hypothetical protein AAWM_01051 [Aspergillus awamori]|uniref:Uncharacterized protein n=1 Tax=Aspergillus awamori TaxID=105351 RepID=A0A401KFZ8_ASPAW|nr:hypothetical protein AAWM_01051 [Aspergillus awamori]GKZ54666.1 hypothetical protein AnigIFM49718_010483 [Aspergillus niger]